MVSSTQSLAYYRRRFIERAFIEEDLPDDLRDTGSMIVQLMLRPQLVAKLTAERDRHAGKPVFDCPAHLNLPSMPRSSRQMSATGVRTFHMGFSDPMRVTSARRSDVYASNKAARESEIDGVASEAELVTAPDEDRSPAIADAYASGHGWQENDRQLVFTNLRPDPDERIKQWDQLERVTSAIGLKRKSQYERGEDRLNIRPARAPKFAAAIAADPECPMGLRELIMSEQQRLAEGKALNARREKVGAPLVVQDATVIHAWIRSTAAWADASKSEREAITLSEGRGRVTYEAFDFELPKEFDALGCANTARGIRDYIAKLPGYPDQAIPNAQVPVTIAVHYPDRLNRPENIHIHGVHARHRAQIGAEGDLPGEDRDLLVEHPMPPALTDRNWKKMLRAEVSRLVNIELERLDAPYRLDPRTDKEIGNDGAPMRKLYGAETIAARAGLQSQTHLENAAEGWRRHFEAIDLRRKEDLAKAEKRRASRRERIAAETPAEAQDEMTTLADRILSADTSRIEACHERQTLEGLIEASRSSSADVAHFAPAYADRAMRKGEPTYDSIGWQRRADEARHHLAGLDVDLSEEREAIAERLRIEAEARQTAERLTNALIFEMARSTWLDVSPALEIVDTPTLASVPFLQVESPVVSQVATAAAPAIPPHLITPAKMPPHRAIILINAEAIRISADGGSLFIDPQDDTDARVAGVDLSAALLQKRLKGLKAVQDRELAAIAAYVHNHPGDALDDERLAGIGGGLPAMIRKWRGSRAFDVMRADIAASRDGRLGPESPVDAPVAAPVTKPSVSTPTIANETLARTLADQATRSVQRADATMAKLLDAMMRKDGSPTPLVCQFMIDLHAKPEYYHLDRDGVLTCRQPSGRATAFALMMRDSGVANHARRYYEAGRASEPLPLPKWLGIDGRLPAHHHNSAEWISTVQREQRQLAARLPDLLASRPKLTADQNGLVGIRDEGLAIAAGANALGLYDPGIQIHLRAAWLIQREEERDAFAMVASGEVEVALKRETASGLLKLASKDPATKIPSLFDPFLDDPAFIASALEARSSRASARSARPALLRAWDAAAHEIGEVRRAIADFVLADPEAVRRLDRAERSALERGAGRAQTVARGAKPRRSGPRRTSRTR